MEQHRVSLWCPGLGAAELRSRLAITEGVDAACEKQSGSLSFEEGSLLPRPAWRAVTDDEFRCITRAASAPSFHSTLGLVRCDPRLVERARGIFHGRQSGSMEPLEARRMRAALAADIASWIDHATDWRVDGEIADLSIFHNDPGKPTVSFDPDTGLHVGMHMDSFDRMPDHLRNRASNRFSINLGTEDRDFLFVQWEAVGLLGALAQVHETEPVAARLATRYLTQFPATPIWRIRLKPGEAYLAPTENIIHDGSSQHMSCRDIHCTLRGYFVPAPSCRSGIDPAPSVRTRMRDGSLRYETVTPPATPPGGTRFELCAMDESPWLRSGAAERFDRPFPIIRVDGAVPPRLASLLYGWIAGLDGWRFNGSSFYEVGELDLCALPVPAGLRALFEPAALARLRAQLGRVFQCRFDPQIRIVAHRMDAGQGAGIHCDDPRGVEETHRMVLTLGQDASARGGGMFAVFDGPSPARVARAWPPAHNQCVLFEASAASFHAITEVREGPRYSVVLSFWRSRAPADGAPGDGSPTDSAPADGSPADGGPS